jgi:hypothetical protein
MTCPIGDTTAAGAGEIRHQPARAALALPCQLVLPTAHNHRLATGAIEGPYAGRGYVDSAEWSCAHRSVLATAWRLARSRPVATTAGALKLSWSQIQLLDRDRLSPITAHPGTPGPGCRAAHRASRKSAVSPLRLPSLSGQLDKSPPRAGLSRTEPTCAAAPDHPGSAEWGKHVDDRCRQPGRPVVAIKGVGKPVDGCTYPR